MWAEELAGTPGSTWLSAEAEPEAALQTRPAGAGSEDGSL